MYRSNLKVFFLGSGVSLAPLRADNVEENFKPDVVAGNLHRHFRPRNEGCRVGPQAERNALRGKWVHED